MDRLELIDCPNLLPWTRVTGHLPEGRELVVVVPPDREPSAGVEEAARLARSGRRVRLVMRGATAPRIVGEAGLPPLSLTELDAYLPGDKGPELSRLVPGLERWLRSVFSDVLVGVDVARAFWASAVTRLGLQDAFASWCLARGIASMHPEHELIICDAEWEGVEALSSLLPDASRWLQLRGRPSRPPGAWGARLLALGTGAAGGALALRAREFVAERAVRKEVARRRDLVGRAAPDVWLGVIGSWAFSSRHVLGSLLDGASSKGANVGVLLQSTLRPGSSLDAFGRPDDRRAILPVLEDEALRGLQVEQCVSYGSSREFLAAAPGNLRAMQRAVSNLARVGPKLDFGPFRHSLVGYERALVKLVTLDVLRAREALDAANAFSGRWVGRGTRIAWSHASLVTDVVPDLVAQRHGATTFDVVHGALAETQDMMTTAVTYSSKKLVWTDAEARYLGVHVRPECVGGVPSRPMITRTRTRPREAPVHVLVLSNYATLAGGAHRRLLPRVCFQDVLLKAVGKSVARLKTPVELRWRPHPGDDRDSVRRALSEFRPRPIELSSTSLEEDLEWCDVVVASLSTTVVEALMYPVPVLVHDVPLHEADVLMGLFGEGRRFRDERDLPEKLQAAVAEVLSGTGLEAERSVRRAFFGQTLEPRDIGEVVYGR